MKNKLFISLSIALAMGFGVAVGAHAEPIKEAKADLTVYCKMEYSWWTVNDAAIGAYAWNSSDETQKNAEWPGVKMSIADSGNDLWSIEIDASLYDKIIFTRVNNDGTTYWGAKTANLDIPSDDNVVYVINSTSAVWGDPGVTGNWVALPSSDNNTYYVYDPLNVLRYDPLKDEPCVYAWGDGVLENSSWPGTSGSVVTEDVEIGGLSVYQVTISESYTSLIMTNGQSENTKQTVDVTDLSSWANDDVLIIGEANGQGKYTTSWEHQGEFEDHPSENGYYLVGSETGWEFDDDNALGAGNDVYTAMLLGYETYYYDDPDPDNLPEAEEFKVASYFNGVKTLYGVGLGDDNYVSTAEQNVNIFLRKDNNKVEVDENAPTEPGYYVEGLFNGVNNLHSYDKKMTEPATYPGDGHACATYSLSDIKVNDEIRVYSYHVDKLTRGVWGVAYDLDANFCEQHGDNIKFTKAGSYDVSAMWESGTLKFTVSEPAEHAFYALFLSETGSLCHAQGGYDSELTTKWGELKTAYLALDKEGVRDPLTTNYNINSGDEHSSDEKLQVIARYGYIVQKYGTDVFEDFIWGQTYAAKKSGFGPFIGFGAIPEERNANMIVLIVTLTSAAALAFGTIFFLKKRKEK